LRALKALLPCEGKVGRIATGGVRVTTDPTFCGTGEYMETWT
jgi:hypothetical protein